jgi:hypothetical protein
MNPSGERGSPLSKSFVQQSPQALVFFGWYGSGPMLGWLVERKINPHIPVLDKAGRDKPGRTNDIWSSTDFEWDVKKTNTSAQRASL